MEMDFTAARSNLVKHNKEKVLLDSESTNRMHHFPHWIMRKQPKKAAVLNGWGNHGLID